jgi:hypothetical protein
MIPKSGNRFPACAKPWHGTNVVPDASAGEGRSERIMREKLRAVALRQRRSRQCNVKGADRFAWRTAQPWRALKRRWVLLMM